MKSIQSLVFVISFGFSFSALAAQILARPTSATLSTTFTSSTPSAPQYGIKDIKIVGSNCVISKLGISIPLSTAGVNPCSKIYPLGTTGKASTGSGTVSEPAINNQNVISNPVSEF